MRVLIAEDDAVSRLILRRAVETLGHECLVAVDGDEAWERYRQGEGDVDVVISDWMMPGLDGVELCRRVRSKPGNVYTYFVLLTALSERRDFLTGMQAGADDYLTKPLDRDELSVRLLAAERITSLHRRLAEQNAELERLNRIVAESARTDPLTGLGNRLRLREDLDALQARVERYGHSYALALYDVDHFKAYNDRYGHLAGDRVLADVAATIRQHCRRGDEPYRFGGEEFLVVLPEQPSDKALIAVERTRKAVRALRLPHPDSPAGRVTVSAGLAVLRPGERRTYEEIVREADAALYRAKRDGRDRSALHEAGNTAAA
jgi:two-component system chemotaxis response regulator CheY